MGAQDDMEKVLRNFHLLFSKSEVYAKEPSKVIVDKQVAIELLADLNKSVYALMEEYEMTKRSRDRAEREFKKQGDEIILDASRKAEDIYAASVMYTDEALSHVQTIMRNTALSIDKLYREMHYEIEEKEKLVRANQLELKSQLQDLHDTEKYARLIEERNKEIAKSKGETKSPSEKSFYANRQTEIKINQEYFEKMGIETEEEKREEVKEENTKAKEAEVKVDLDADYFKWKEGKEIEKKENHSKEKSERFQNVLKSFTPNKKK